MIKTIWNLLSQEVNAGLVYSVDSSRTHGKQQVSQAARCFPLDALLHLVPRQLHVGIKHWNTHSFSISLTTKQLQTNGCSLTFHLSLSPSQTFPKVFSAPVAQDGDEGLFISAKMLLSCLEQSLEQQK